MSNLLTTNGKDIAIPVIINQRSCLYPFNPDPATCLLDGPELIVPIAQNSFAIYPITKQNLTNEIILPRTVKSNANFIQVTSSIYLLYGEVITPKFIPASHLCLADSCISFFIGLFNISAPYQIWNNGISNRNSGSTQDLSNGYNFNGELIIPFIISADSILNPYPSSDLLTEAYGQDVSIPMIIKKIPA
uniref:Uncharacterized protein n=1 Tax=Ditylenchus dipsaci TaxID=166011 RepID=A0A915DNS6_9BILA